MRHFMDDVDPTAGHLGNRLGYAVPAIPRGPTHPKSFEDTIDDETSDARPPTTALVDDSDMILISQAAYAQALHELRSRAPEQAGLLMGPKDHEAITHFLLDEDGDGTPASFALGAKGLNKKVKMFLAAGLDIKGIAHSHPAFCLTLSQGDLVYLSKLFGNPKNAALVRFCMPIVAGGHLYPYVVSRQEDDPRLSIRPAKCVLF